MSVAAAAKAIQAEHKIPREMAARLAKDTRASMPGNPPTKAIVAEARYLIRRVKDGKPTPPIGSGLRFRRQVDAILTSMEQQGERMDPTEAKRRASAIAAKQMRDAYGDTYVQYLAAMGKRRAKVEQAAIDAGELVRLPQRRPAMAEPALPRLRAANPLANGCSPAARSENIRELRSTGRPMPQAIAIALSHQRTQGCDVPARKTNPVGDDVLNEALLPLPNRRWRASDNVHVECDADGYCVVVQPPNGKKKVAHRTPNPVEAVTRAKTISLVAAGVVNPQAPKTPDRRGKARANPVSRARVAGRKGNPVAEVKYRAAPHGLVVELGPDESSWYMTPGAFRASVLGEAQRRLSFAPARIVVEHAGREIDQVYIDSVPRPGGRRGNPAPTVDRDRRDPIVAALTAAQSELAHGGDRYRVHTTLAQRLNEIWREAAGGVHKATVRFHNSTSATIRMLTVGADPEECAFLFVSPEPESSFHVLPVRRPGFYEGPDAFLAARALASVPDEWSSHESIERGRRHGKAQRAVEALPGSWPGATQHELADLARLRHAVALNPYDRPGSFWIDVTKSAAVLAKASRQAAKVAEKKDKRARMKAIGGRKENPAKPLLDPSLPVVGSAIVYFDVDGDPESIELSDGDVPMDVMVRHLSRRAAPGAVATAQSGGRIHVTYPAGLRYPGGSFTTTLKVEGRAAKKPRAKPDEGGPGRKKNFITRGRDDEPEEEDEEPGRKQREAEAKLDKAFGSHSGVNADWQNPAWYVGGSGEENRNPKRMDIPAGLYTHHSVWVYRDDAQDYCVLERTIGRDGEETEIDEILCAGPDQIETVIAQARFHAERLIPEYAAKQAKKRKDNPAKKRALKHYFVFGRYAYPPTSGGKTPPDAVAEWQFRWELDNGAGKRLGQGILLWPALDDEAVKASRRFGLHDIAPLQTHLARWLRDHVDLSTSEDARLRGASFAGLNLEHPRLPRA